MKKIIFSLIITAALILSVTSVIFAEGQNQLLDYADILTEDEETALLELLTQIKNSEGYDIAVVTVKSLDGKSKEAYSDDFYDYNGYGVGSDSSGILLLISMDPHNRGFHFTTYGRPDDNITEEEVEYILDDIYTPISNGNYYDACIAFAYSAEQYISQSSEDDNIFANILISLVIGFILAFITVTVMKGKLKSVRLSDNASQYIVQNSLKLTARSDIYLYKTLNRTPIPRNNSSNGGGGSHVSSSGRTHGGGGRSF